MKESHAQAPGSVSLSLSLSDFLAPMLLFYFSSFPLYFPFSSFLLPCLETGYGHNEYTVRHSFEGHADLHLFQNRGTVSIAEPSPSFQFASNMKITTETEKFVKTRSSCLVLFKKDPDAHSRWGGVHPPHGLLNNCSWEKQPCEWPKYLRRPGRASFYSRETLATGSPSVPQELTSFEPLPLLPGPTLISL